MPTIEQEFCKVARIPKQKANEPRITFIERLMKAGQNMTNVEWESLSNPAQEWYNVAIRTHNNTGDYTRVPDPAEEPAEGEPVEAEIDEPVEEGEAADVEAEAEEVEEAEEPEPEELEPEEIEEPEAEAEEPEPEPEPEPVRPQRVARATAAPAPKPVPPVKKPAPPVKAAAAPVKTAPPPRVAPVAKAPVKPTTVAEASAKKAVAKAANGGGQVQEAQAPGTMTVVKRILLKRPDASVAEIVEALNTHGIEVSRTTVTTIRNDFRHSLKVMQDEGYIQGIVL